MGSSRNNVPNSNAPDEIVTLLSSPHADDRQFLSKAFSHPQWKTEWARDCAESRRILERVRTGVVVCERDLPDGCWRDILHTAQLLPNPPNVIVASRHADEYLWAEVLNLGGYDVLVKPFDTKEVLRVIGLAFLQYSSRAKTRKPARTATSGARFLFGS